MKTPGARTLLVWQQRRVSSDWGQNEASRNHFRVKFSCRNRNLQTELRSPLSLPVLSFSITSKQTANSKMSLNSSALYFGTYFILYRVLIHTDKYYYRFRWNFIDPTSTSCSRKYNPIILHTEYFYLIYCDGNTFVLWLEYFLCVLDSAALVLTETAECGSDLRCVWVPVGSCWRTGCTRPPSEPRVPLQGTPTAWWSPSEHTNTRVTRRTSGSQLEHDFWWNI